MQQQVRDQRKEGYKSRFETTGGDYEGGYYGAEPLLLSILPDYLRLDELTNWLFTFQIRNNEAYLYALSQYRQTNSDLWLLTAISKAEKTSSELNSLLKAAEKVDRSAPAYPTIAFHKTRVLIELGKAAEARKLLDDILNSTLELPISSRNQLLKLRLGLSETLEDFLKFAQLKPFTFDMDGESGTIEHFIELEKSYYDPKYETQSREEFDKEIEDRFKNEKDWEDRTMFDSDTIELMNQHFPLTVLLEAEKSAKLPEYLRERFAVAIWTRAMLLNDFMTFQKITPEVIKFHPDLKELSDKVLLAKTEVGRQRAAIYLILKNPMVSPFLEDGLGKSDNEFGSFDANDWWCAPYDITYDETTNEEVPSKPPPKPVFLTAAQSETAQAERKKLKEIGDAPKYMGEKVLEWARLAPTDKRIPELLYIVWEANGWTKYGCGNNEELKAQIGAILKKKYPQSEWTVKMLNDEKEQN
jgi:tetratricopeptide (TPR) repeat protein